MKKALKFISMLLVLLCAIPMLNCRKSNNNNKKQAKTVSVLELQSSLSDGDWQFDVAQNDNGEYSFSYFPNSTDQYLIQPLCYRHCRKPFQSPRKICSRKCCF